MPTASLVQDVASIAEGSMDTGFSTVAVRNCWKLCDV